MGRIRIFVLLCCALHSAAPALPAQQSVDLASVSGRVTDPVGRGRSRRTGHRPPHGDQSRHDGRQRSGGALPAPLPSRRAVRNCRAASGVSGRRSPVHGDRRRRLRAAGVPVAEGRRCERRGSRRRGGPRGRAQPDRRNRRGGRGAQPADERPQLPRARAARPRGLADECRQHAAVSGNIGGPRRDPLGGEPAQPVEQLHRGWLVGQRRCGGVERDHLWSGCHRAGAGGDLRRPGRAGARARRFRQRRDEERHEPAPRNGVQLPSGRQAQRREPAVASGTADGAGAIRREPGRPGRHEPHVLLRERRAAASRPDRPHHDHRRQRRGDQRAVTVRWLCRSASDYRHVSQSGGHHERARQNRPSDRRAQSSDPSLQPVRRSLRALPRRRRPERAERFRGTRQSRPGAGARQHAGPVVAHGPRSARASGARRSPCAGDRSDRSRGDHRRRRHLWNTVYGSHPA